MYQTITRRDFIEQFRTMGRLEAWGTSGNFTVDALSALFDYLEELESDVGEEMEFDVIALCCQFSEYGSALEAVEDTKPDCEPVGTEEDALDWLEYRTSVIEFPGGIIIDSEF